MGFTAEYQLGSQQQPLTLCDVARAVPDLTVQLEGAEQPQSGPMLFLICVTGTSFDGLDATLEGSQFVGKYSLIEEIGSTRLYQLTMTFQRPSTIEELLPAKIATETVTILANGWQIKQQFADRDELAKVRDLARSMDIPFHLNHLYESTSTDTDLIGLTDKQRVALIAAYEAGYFTVPRQASMAAVAATLDISSSALTERLHRAQAHLIEHFVYSDVYKTPADLDTD